MTSEVRDRSTTDQVTSLLMATLAQPDRTPISERLTVTLDAAIRDGTLPPGMVLPKEPDLAKHLGLSRQTVGRALGALAQRGLLVRRRGIGTFVASTPPIEQPLGNLSSLIQTLAIDGMPPAARLIGVRLAARPEIARQLTGSEDALVWEIGRLFSVDGEPFALEWIYLRVDCGAQLPGDKLADGVIDDLLREYCDVVVDRGEELLSLATLDRSEATFLGQPSGTPAFQIVRTAFANDHVVELRRRLIRGDRARFRVSLSGPDHESSPMMLTVDPAVTESSIDSKKNV